MIDIHSHILPCVDDGAQSIEDALELLGFAQDDGVSTQFLTPHIRPPRYINNPDKIWKLFYDFYDVVVKCGLKIKLHLSTEVRINSEIMSLLQREDFPWLGLWNGKKTFLLEMPHGHVPPGTTNLIKWLVQRDILPVIVHPERNRDFQSDYGLLKDLTRMGCLIQITGASLMGKFGNKASQSAIKLLTNNLVTFMATDCHNIFHRPPDLSKGYNQAKKLIGKEKAWSLVYDAPLKLLENQVHCDR